MSSCCYTRFSLPVSRLTSSDQRHAVAAVASMSIRELDALLRGPIDSDVAGYGNTTTLRMVFGTPCMVIENDSWRYAGSEAEEQLIAARIPYLRVSDSGIDGGATVAIYAGRGNPITLYCSHESSDDVLVPVSIAKGKAVLDTSWMKSAQQFAKIRVKLFA